jgi:hypothetical protein
MKTVSTVLAGVLAAQFLSLGAAKLAAIAPMRTRAEHLGYTVAAYRDIGALELAAAAGVLIGLTRPAIGVAAGTGLTLLMAGAAATHARNGDGAPEIAPAAVTGVLSLAYITTVLAR